MATNNTAPATKVIVPCRISFANIWEPKSINGSEEKYSVSCLIPKEDKATIKKISSADNGVGHVVETTFSGAQGSITMAVGVDSEGKCAGISIIKHSETSGLGEVAASSSDRGVSFRKSFIGKDETITINDIDAITGATITSKAVTGAVATAIEAVKSLG